MGHYYILGVDVEPKVIGVRDGCAQAEIQRSGFKDKKAYDRSLAFLGSYDSWTRAQDEPDFNIELQRVQMRKSAKPTDFMLFAPVLIVFISERLRDGTVSSKLVGAEIEPAFGRNSWWRPTLEIPD